jgi:hypothetical protein
MRNTVYPTVWLSGLAEFLLLVILKMHLAKVIVAIIAMPARQGVADHALSDRLVVVIIFSWFCRRRFLLPWLWLHVLCLKELNLYSDAPIRVPQKLLMMLKR